MTERKMGFEEVEIKNCLHCKLLLYENNKDKCLGRI